VRKIYLLVCFVCVHEIHALDIGITGKAIEARLGGEYSRSYNFYGDISAIGAVELNKRLAIRTGFSTGWAQGITDIKAFTGARFGLLEKWPLGLGFYWMYNGLPEYKAHSHTLFPCLSWNAKYCGIALGPSFRLTSFFYEQAVFEPILSISVYANFINNEKLRIGAILANFNEFQTRNFSQYSLCVNSTVRINGNWSVLGELEARQSGGDGLSAAFYAVALRTGARLTW